MTADERTAVLARMVSRSPKTPGRTAVMKLVYFLQEYKGVSLGYDFRLFTYGPFDADVLSDLSAAVADGTVTETMRLYARGYGYEIAATPTGDQLAATLPAHVASAADEVARLFGQYDAAELELRSTIFYVEREASHNSEPLNIEALAERVHEVKPHFATDKILARITEMRAAGLFASSTALAV